LFLNSKERHDLTKEQLDLITDRTKGANFVAAALRILYPTLMRACVL